MFCEKCQTENHEQNNYCTNCGRRLLKNKIPTADLDDLEKNSRTINSINRIIKGSKINIWITAKMNNFSVYFFPHSAHEPS